MELKSSYVLRDGRFPVIIGDERFSDGTIGVFVLGAILAALDDAGVTGIPDVDLSNGDTFGRLPITEKEFERVTKWDKRGDFVTITPKVNGGYRWGFVTRRQLIQNEYMTLEELHLLKAWIELATSYFRKRKLAEIVDDSGNILVHNKPEKNTEKERRRKKKKGKKHRKKKHNFIDDEFV